MFLLATVILFRDDITVENLRYLFKDLEIGDNISVTSNDDGRQPHRQYILSYV